MTIFIFVTMEKTINEMDMILCAEVLIYIVCAKLMAHCSCEEIKLVL